ncbi:HYR domain-containing protein [Idiomarina aquatica]|uniref:HYR domain-containing protein n=1 Tax=Idiomarina aquatica TaxID=1327752 RepID=A0AA94JDV4_9GAMM|nr:HYR domain-containing protein [Idiomarina aquatica]RUO45182.1 hypothetical protein CWE23_03955 [Idiomarina aquatica]
MHRAIVKSFITPLIILISLVLTFFAPLGQAQQIIDHDTLNVNRDYSINANQMNTHNFVVPDDHQGWRLVVEADWQVRVRIWRIVAGGNLQSIYDQTRYSQTFFLSADDLELGTAYKVTIQSQYDRTYRLVSQPQFAQPLSWTAGLSHQNISNWQTPSTENGFNGGEWLFYLDYQDQAQYQLIRGLLKVANRSTAVKLGTQINDYQQRFAFTEQAQHAVFYQRRDALTNGSRLYLKVQPKIVRDTNNQDWKLAIGDPHVIDLGTLSTDVAANGRVENIIEPYVFYKTQVSAETPAWQLYLSNAAGAESQRTVYVSNDQLASQQHHQQAFFQSQLIVPNYLSSGRYFIAVATEQAATIDLRSRIQPQQQLSFNSTQTITTDANAEFPYTTYKVPVPVDQIGWQITLAADTPNSSLYVRQANVPNRLNNNGFSEQSDTTIESITHAPPTLANGAWYITVYAPAGTTATLTNGSPVVTDINFVTTNPGITNQAPYTQQTGWRYFRVRDLDQQLGILGWTLFLEQQPPGSRLSIRRNAVPTYWEYRQNDSTSIYNSRLDDEHSQSGVLQVASHQADVWYIGVYSEAALGAFTLNTDTNTPPNLDFNNGEITETNKDHRYWHYYQLQVPEQFEALELYLENQGEERLDMVLQRDTLPDRSGVPRVYCPSRTHIYNCDRWLSNEYLSARTAYAPFAQYDSTSTDLRLVLGKNAPLSPGNYFIGVKSATYAPSAPLNFTLRARGIGQQCGDENCHYSITAFNPDEPLSLTLASAGERAYAKVALPDNNHGWQLTTNYSNGDGDTLLRVDGVANSYASENNTVAITRNNGGISRSPGSDFYYALKNAEGNVVNGDLYITVAANQDNTQAQLNLQPLAYTENNDSVVRQGQGVSFTKDTWPAGQITFYRFNVEPTQPAITASVTSDGEPDFQLALLKDGDNGIALPDPWATNVLDGENGSTNGTNEVTLPDAGGRYTLAVYSKDQASNVNVSISAQNLPSATNLAFNNGVTQITDQAADTWQYYKVVVPNDAQGWMLEADQVSNNNLAMIIRKGELPDALTESGGSACSYRTPLSQCNTWQDGEQLSANHNFYRRSRAADGSYLYNRSLIVGKNAPLTAGVYYVGLYTTADNTSYRLRSRGVGNQCGGSACTIAVQAIEFPGQVSDSIATPGDIKAYQFSIPESLAGVEIYLQTTLGDSMLKVSRNSIPLSTTSSNAIDSNHGVLQDTSGDEFVYEFHRQRYDSAAGTNVIQLPAGDYFITVYGLGANPPYNNALGSGTSSYTLAAKPMEPVRINHEPLAVNQQISIANQQLEPGELRWYTVAADNNLPNLEFNVANTTGDPSLRILATDANQPQIPNSPIRSTWDTASGGVYGPSTAVFPYTLTDVGNFYSLLLGSEYAHALTTDLSIRSRGDQELDFNRGRLTIDGQPQASWRYFKVEVPEDADGWEVILNPHQDVNIQAVIARDVRPDRVRSLSCSTGGLLLCNTWETGHQLVLPTASWADNGRRLENGAEVIDYAKRVVIGQRPLQPGTYYIGVTAPDNDNVSYDIISRGIGTSCGGENCQLAVDPINFDTLHNGSINTPGEADYFTFTVPEDVSGWYVDLQTALGDAALAIKYAQLPNSNASRNQTETPYGAKQDTLGSEYFYQLSSELDATPLRPGKYYAAVISQGQREPDFRGLGEGSVNYSLRIGPVQVASLGSGHLTTATPEQTGLTTIDYVQVKAYQLTMDENVDSVELRFSESAGQPVINVANHAQGERWWPRPYFNNRVDSAVEGGRYQERVSGQVINIDTPQPVMTILVHGEEPSGDDVSSQFNLQATATQIQPLVFANGDSGRQSLLDQQQHLYRVNVPEDSNGWTLDLNVSVGNVSLAISKGQLPGKVRESERINSREQQTHIVAPYLTPGTWYISAQSTGLSEYSLQSKELVSEDTTTLGVRDDYTQFQTGEVDLERQHTHYYRINVPDNNEGIIRTQLTKISGEAKTYLRYGAPPTLSHSQTRPNGELYDRADTTAGTQYANWGVQDARDTHHNGLVQLAPGEWWLAVVAEDSSLRYQLEVSTPRVKAMAFSGASAHQQNLAEGDIRYYRVHMPAVSTETPMRNLRINLTQQSGDVAAIFREHLPPAELFKSGSFNPSNGSLAHWYFDNGDNTDLPYALEEGELSVPIEHIKPDVPFYIGIYAKEDSQYSLSIGPGEQTLSIAQSISVVNGELAVELAPQQTKFVHIRVPADTEWFRQRIEASAAIDMRLQREKIGFARRPIAQSSSEVFEVERELLDRQRTIRPYPWQPTVDYFVTLHNPGSETVIVGGTTNGNVWQPDTQAPVFPDLADITREATGPLTSFTLPSVYAQDDYDGRVRAATTQQGPWAVGDYIITWTAIDESGNQSTAQQRLIIADTRAPSITVPATITREATAPLTPVELGEASATDIVDGELTPTASNTGPFAVGSHDVEWQVTDAAGNSANRTQRVTITDTTAPNLTVPADHVVIIGPGDGVDSAGFEPLQQWLAEASAEDLVDESVEVSHNVPAVLTVGELTVTFTAMDTAGNQAQQTSQLQVVMDDAAPVLSLPEPLVIMVTTAEPLPTSDARIQAFLNAATAYDEQDGEVTVQHNLGSTVPYGLTYVLFSAEDSLGNRTEQEVSLRIKIDTPPRKSGLLMLLLSTFESEK